MSGIKSKLQALFEWLVYVKPRPTKIKSVPWAGPLLARLLSLMIGLLLLLTFSNAFQSIVSPSAKTVNFLLIDLFTLAILVGLWVLNRLGFSATSGALLVLILAILPALTFLPEDLDRLLVVYAVPIGIAGFSIQPFASFVAFVIAIITYSYVYLQSGLQVEYNYLGIAILGGIAALTSLTAAWLTNVVCATQRCEETEREVNQQLRRLQASLEQEVQKRTQQVQVAAYTAQAIATAQSATEILQKVTELLCDKLGYSNAFIYLLDVSGQAGLLAAAAGKHASLAPKRYEVDEKTSIGHALLETKIRVITAEETDSLHFPVTFAPETKSLAILPIKAGERLLGALVIHSQQNNAFDEIEILVLQILASLVAASLQNFQLTEAMQFDLSSISEVYRYGHLVAQSKNSVDVYRALEQAFSHTHLGVLFLEAQENGCTVMVNTSGVPTEEWLPLYPGMLHEFFASNAVIGSIAQMTALPAPLKSIFQNAKFEHVALVPIYRAGQLRAVLALGSQEKKPLPPLIIQPYASLAELAVSSLERIQSELAVESRLNELEAITITSQALSSVTDLDTLFSSLHDHVRRTMGDVSFLVALYNPQTNSIRIPYMYEHSVGGQRASVEEFPLGEGLTSILIRTRQPLMIVEDTERRALALGAKISGKPAKSWLGCPLIVANDVIGAIIVQDTERENAFDESDLRFLTTLSAQVAGTIYNIRLLEETKRRALQLETAAEIARDISTSLDINEVLAKAVNLIRERFNFYHAAVFLIDPTENYAVVREATGEAGAQMKRAGHRLKVGSQSIVGYVTSSGEPLIVNDTQRDATYYPNPLLPDTRAEAAIPLKIGQRVLGALDVQSERPFAFGQEEINVLRILADQLAVAVINSELFAETQEHLSQHRLLHHVTSAAASGTTLQEALNSAAQGLQVTLGGDRVAILLADRKRNILKIEAVAGFSEDVKQVEIPFGQGITGWVAAHQKPLRVSDVTKDPRYLQIGSNTRSEMAIPLLYRGELLGVLNVESDQPNAYSENDEELLGTLGGSLAAIIANARLLEQIRKQAERERLLYEATSRIRRSTDFRAIIAATAAEAVKALGARQARIVLGPQATQATSQEKHRTGKENG